MRTGLMWAAAVAAGLWWPVSLAGAAGAGAAEAGAAGPAGELAVGPDSRSALSVTVYGGDMALVKDRRRVPLDAGETAVAFEGVSARILPETVLLRPAPGDAGFSVVEQIFDNNLITPENLLRLSVGQEIGLSRIDRATGREVVRRARVLSDAGGGVLEIDGKIYAKPAGQPVYDALPPGLRPRPTLVARVESAEAGLRQAELSYLTGGLSWKADYVAELADGDGRLDLAAWATVANTTGVGFEAARLKLVAGEVNRAPRPMMPVRALRKDMMMAEAAAPAPDVSEESFAGYHLYEIARPVSLADNQSKQLALLSAAGVAVRRELVAESGMAAYHGRNGNDREYNAKVFLAFDNDDAHGLGLPLPAGVVRVYKKDSSGAAQFVGEDRLDHTATGRTVRLRLGADFDVPVKRTQTDYRRLSDRMSESGHRITLANAGPKAVAVKVVEHLPGEWEILKESHDHDKAAADRAEWVLAVPPGGETVLDFQVRVRF